MKCVRLTTLVDNSHLCFAYKCLHIIIFGGKYMISIYLKKSLAFLLTLLLVISVLPAQVLAVENSEVEGQVTPTLSLDDGASSRALSDNKISVSSKNTSGKFNVTTSGTSITAKAEYNGVRAKGTLVIKNTRSSSVILSFGYKLSGDKASVSGAISSSSGFFQKVVNANATIEIAIDTGGFFNNATLYIENISAKEIITGSANVNVEYNSSLGNVSGAGENAGTAGQNITVSAAASAGSKFLAWTDESNMILSTSASYTFIASGNDTLKALFANPNGDAYFSADGNVSVGRYLHSDLNKAVATGSKIVLVADGTLAAGNYTVPAGVTLLIPRDASYTIEEKRNIPNGIDKESNAYVVPSAFRTLRMATGANITVKGDIYVAGQQYAGGTGQTMGGVYGPVGFIRMSEGSKITVNNGASLYAWGYVIGSGEVEILSGGYVYESFQATDWRGGSATSALATDDNNSVFPMTQYYVQNIEVPMKLNAGATERGYSCTTVTPVALLGVKGAEVPFIGSGNDNLFTIESGYVIKDYDEATDRQTYKVYGNLSMKKIKVSMAAGMLGANITLDSSKYVLPLTNNLTIDVCSGTIYITQDLCFLPGSEIIIREGATGNLADGKSVYVYDLDEWGGYVSSYNATHIPLSYAPGRLPGVNRVLTDAKVQIDGTINASAGYLYTTKGGAIVTSTGTGKVFMKSGTATKTYQISQNNTDTSNVEIPVIVAKLQNADGTTTNPAKEINPAAGTAYIYTDGKWVARCRNNTCTANGQPTCSTGLPCKFCGQMIKPGHKYTSTVTTPATCVTEGVRTYTCSGCNDSYTEDIPATGVHTYTDSITTPATCTTEGVRTFDCNDCDDTYTEKIPVEEHTSVKDDAVPATCTKDGKTEGAHCSVCNEVLIPQETVPATSHKYTDAVTTPATCTTEGVRTFTCSVCSDSYTEKIDSLGGHKLNWTETKPSTAFEEGESTGKCQVCDYSEKKAIAKLLVIAVRDEVKNKVMIAQSGNVIALDQITVSTMLENITDKSEIVTADGKKVADNAKIATGMKIVLKDGAGQPVEEKTIIVPGDVNCDGSVSAADARAALRRSVNLDVIKDYQENAADTDRNNKITASDAREILRASVGLVDKNVLFNKYK